MADWIDETAARLRAKNQAAKEAAEREQAEIAQKRMEMEKHFPLIWDAMRLEVSQMVKRFNENVGEKIASYRSGATSLHVGYTYNKAGQELHYTVNPQTGAIMSSRVTQLASGGRSEGGGGGVAFEVQMDGERMIFVRNGKPSTPSEVANAIVRDALTGLRDGDRLE